MTSFKPVSWKDITNGDIVYIEDLKKGQPHPYGPFTVKSKSLRVLMNEEQGTFRHVSENLLKADTNNKIRPYVVVKRFEPTPAMYALDRDYNRILDKDVDWNACTVNHIIQVEQNHIQAGQMIPAWARHAKQLRGTYGISIWFDFYEVG